MPRAVAPHRFKLAVVTWLALYPTITLLLPVLERLGLAAVPLPLRTLCLTLIVVPLMVYVLMPVVTRMLESWLQR